MKTLSEKISVVSSCLQSLTAPEYAAVVERAVERKDRVSLVELCKRAKVPTPYIHSVVSVILSVGPNEKYPAVF